jgi:hypothetical protein
MRRFTDHQGEQWDVVVGRASWGAHYALFVPYGTSEQAVRQTPITADTADAGMRELDALDEAGLQALLDRSTITSEGMS